MRRASYTSEGYYWQLEYCDTVKLLEQKILLFIRRNEKLRNNIRDKSRFVNNTVDALEINLMEFSEAYRQRFIALDMEAYVMRFIDLLIPIIKDFLKEIGFGAFSFRFVFRFGGKVIEKYKSVLAPADDENKNN